MTVYFVCVGNTCRSPMAAELFNQMMLRLYIEDVKADSFGLMPFYSDSEEVKRFRESAVLRVTGFMNGLKGHRPKGIESITFSDGDRIVLLDRNMLDPLICAIQRRPSFNMKHVPVVVIDINDPFGGGPKDYFDCCATLNDIINSNFNVIVGKACA